MDLRIADTFTDSLARLTGGRGGTVLDPTCDSHTTATSAELWSRGWITIDTSRVALALARARIVGAQYRCYVRADSSDSQFKVAEVTRTAPSSQPVCMAIGFATGRFIARST